MTKAAEFNINCIQSIPIFVADLERATKFWTYKLAFQLVTSISPPTLPFVTAWKVNYVAPPGGETTLALLVNDAALGTDRRMARAIFQCDDVPSAYHRLRGCGVDVSEIQLLPDGIWLSFSDEDSNLFFLRQECEPDAIESFMTAGLNRDH